MSSIRLANNDGRGEVRAPRACRFGVPPAEPRRAHPKIMMASQQAQG